MGNAGQQLKKLRIYLNLTQEEFGNAVSVKRNSIAMIESGKNKPTFELISDICGVFNLTADYFLSDDNPESFSEYLAYSKVKGKVTNNDKESKREISKSADNGASLIEAKIREPLMLLANSSLLYIEFHLSDILLNLKLLRENALNKPFDRTAYEKNQKKIAAQILQMKSLLKSDQLKSESLLKSLVQFDEAIRDYLDEIREVSKELHLNTPRKQGYM